MLSPQSQPDGTYERLKVAAKKPSRLSLPIVALSTLLAACGGNVTLDPHEDATSTSTHSSSVGQGGNEGLGGQGGEGGVNVAGPTGTGGYGGNSGDVGGNGGAGGEAPMFIIDFLGPPPGTTAPIGQADTSCMDLLLTNNTGKTLTFGGYKVGLYLPHGPGDSPAAGLVNTGVDPATANYNNIVVRDDQTVFTFPGELSTVQDPNFPDSDIQQVVDLVGDRYFLPGFQLQVRIAVDIALNPAMIGDGLECILQAPYQVQDLDGVPLDPSQISVNGGTFGNQINITN